MRIGNLLKGVNKKNTFEILDKWEKHLHKELEFPFVAEICEYQERGVLKEGDILSVKGINSSDDLYGVLANASFQRKQYVFSLCDLRVMDENSTNYLHVNDYCAWFANR